MLRGDDRPGPELLGDLVEAHRRAAGGSARFTQTGDPVPLPADARLAIYRTCQEALTNVRKHAPGASVDVSLCWNADTAVLTIDDRDSSIGPRQAPGAGYGLTGMAERAELLGGQLTAGPTATGFRVELTVPLAHVSPQAVAR